MPSFTTYVPIRSVDGVTIVNGTDGLEAENALELIETHVVTSSAETNFDFSTTLDGTKYIGYVIMGVLVDGSASGSHNITLRANGGLAAGADQSVSANTTTISTSARAYPLVAYTTSTYECSIHFVIHGVGDDYPSDVKYYQGFYFSDRGTDIEGVPNGKITTTSITSLGLACQVGTADVIGVGTELRLYGIRK